MDLKDALKHFSPICKEKYECFSEQASQSPFFGQKCPQISCFKNISLEMALRYVKWYINENWTKSRDITNILEGNNANIEYLWGR